MTAYYLPIEDERYFTREKKYSAITWTSLTEAIKAFQQRIQGWYIDPAKKIKEEGHHVFSLLAINCLLIDTLSQFDEPTNGDDGDRIKTFVKAKLKGFTDSINPPIKYIKKSGKEGLLNDVGDVFYHGFRCGILHQAHCPLYGAVAPLGGTTTFKIELSGSTIYAADGKPCPCVILDPTNLWNETETLFETYIVNLQDKDSSHDALRKKLQFKMLTTFGLTKIPDTL